MCLAVPGQVVAIVDGDQQLATVDLSGVRRSVSLACLVTPDRPIEQWVGRWVVVHAGFALEELDVAAATETLTWIDRLTTPA
ncbi:MAG: HypC/HybG/HupF family hydrogenase formation chaperone [Limnothrix sp. CACIAM 69d]|jgi:hydrogenase expression/formation protein HypC|nr:MAG: HypC/HybG/HupF family hydrogenase formation chaperone [Limnothrix sp. CACIAM 69d]